MDEIEKQREKMVEKLKRFPSGDHFREDISGVLLADRIEKYSNNFNLIYPFCPENLRPASYKLTFGSKYCYDNNIGSLPAQDGNDKIAIDPFSVAIIQTTEIINLPNWLIARWNIRVQWAYEGLLWVGGPQVDPGYVGHLFCPLYNLSDKKVYVQQGEGIACIDFVMTTPIPDKDHNTNYEPFRFPPRRVILEDYKPKELRSGLYELAANRIKQFEDDLKEESDKLNGQLVHLTSRVDTFTSVIFVAIGAIVSALSLIVTKQADISVTVNSLAVLIAAIALLTSITSFAFATRSKMRHAWWVCGIFVLVLIGGLVIGAWCTTG